MFVGIFNTEKISTFQGSDIPRKLGSTFLWIGSWKTCENQGTLKKLKIKISLKLRKLFSQDSISSVLNTI